MDPHATVLPPPFHAADLRLPRPAPAESRPIEAATRVPVAALTKIAAVPPETVAFAAFAGLLYRYSGRTAWPIAMGEHADRACVVEVDGSAPLEALCTALHQAAHDACLGTAAPTWFLPQSLPAALPTTVELACGVTPEPGDALCLTVRVAPGLVDPTAAERLADHLGTLLHGALEQPTAPLDRLPVLTQAERTQVLHTWNATDQPQPEAACLHTLFARQAAQTPEAPAALIGEQTLSYDVLDAHSNQLARWLQQQGVEPGMLVGLAVNRTSALLTSLLAILKVGAAYVPLDLTYPEARLHQILDDSQATVLLTQAEGRHQLGASYSGTLIDLDEIRVPLRRLDRSPLNVPTSPDDLAYVIYTSGSTGRPKGVAIAHRSASALLDWADTVYTAEDLAGVLAATSVCFDLSVFELFWPLTRGGCVILADHAVALPGLPDANRVRLLNTVPSAAQHLIKTGGIPDSVRTINLAGEPLSPALVDQLYAETQATRVFDLYGPSEDTTYSTVALRRPGAAATIGRPLPHTHAYVLDARQEPVPIGVPGELYLGGPGLAEGYLHRPDLTAERFVPNPLAEAPARLYRTGDLVRYREDGHLVFVGRLDHQVKVRGHRIELGEIEAVMQDTPSVETAIAQVHPYPDGPRLVAYLTPHPPEAEADTPDPLIRSWHAAFEAAYDGAPALLEDAVNAAGYVETATGAPMPTEQMATWLSGVVARIQALRPRRLLEIGCGTGMLVARLAPEAERYVAVDPSSTALTYLHEHVIRPAWAHVETRHATAAVLHDLDDEAFDTVVLNSVVQYFPSEAYLREVIGQAVRCTTPGGHLFLGDVRSLALEAPFLTELALNRAETDALCGPVWLDVRTQQATTQELLCDPAWFYRLMETIPGVAHVEVHPRLEAVPNEMVRFRYDVVLHVGPAPLPTLVRPNAWTDAQAPGWSVQALSEQLQAGHEAIIGIRGLPSVHTWHAVQQWQQLSSADPMTPLADVAPPAPRPLHTPHDLAHLAASQGYQATFSVLHAADGATFDAVFYRAPGPAPVDVGAPMRSPDKPLINRPLVGRTAAGLANRARHHVERHLPAYMVPSAFIPMPALPRTPNGKVNRRALPAPDLRRTQHATHRPPTTELERLLVERWEAFLGVRPLGVDDDFFDLGGTSLLAAELFLDLHERLDLDLPLALMAKAPTVAELARVIKRGQVNEAWSSLVPLQLHGTRPPLFCVHGGRGNVLNFERLARRLGDEQPVYGLQWDGLDGSAGRNRIDAMATAYLEEVRQVQPHGPYLLAGHCTGGAVALEIAHQLRAAGEAVPLLIMFNTPTHRSALYTVSAQTVWHGLQRDVQRQFQKLRRVLPPTWRLRYWRWRLSQTPVPPDERGDYAALALTDAMQHHAPRPYDGPVVYFDSGETELSGYLGHWHGEALGWPPYLSDLTRYAIDANHNAIVHHPDTAAHLQRHLDAVAAAFEAASVPV
ncbi:MAG: amino acid adenylation domain-containing protein [Bacteroidota bacterium]